MTTQEAYEKMRVWFTRPGAQLARVHRPDEDPRCVYRADGDAASPIRCAFGCLLPDDLYDPRLENKTASALLKGRVDIYPSPGEPSITVLNTSAIKEHFEGVDTLFLDEAQSDHDATEFYIDNEYVDNSPQVFVKRLDRLAKRFSLDVPRARALCTPACPED